MPPPRRFAIVEYGPPTAVIADMAAATRRPIGELRELVLQRGERAAATLGLSDSPITLTGSAVRAEGIAGILRIDRGVEIEIAPKFLGEGDGHIGWAEDFFFLAMLSRHGYLLAKEGISSARGTSDLMTLLANALIGMYWQLHRRPLKAYRNIHERSFFLDGEVDPFDLRLPSADGFAQTSFQFTRSNPTNALIKLAAEILAKQVRSHQLQEQLTRLASHLGPQPQPSRREIDAWRLPPRVRAWQPLLDLSIDIISGIGAGLRPGDRRGPGFIVNTWRVWQDLLSIAARIHFGGAHALPEKPRVLGSRDNLLSGKTRDLVVRPDLRIQQRDTPLFLVDAKYKGRAGRSGFRVSEADVYESMAFSRASDDCPVVLAYPRTADKVPRQLGCLSVLERIEVGATRIVAVDVEVRGISSKGGLPRFCEQFGAGLAAVLAVV
jgi:5-methylcytosine-specific restriction enzyme subunit McrC